MAALTDRQRIQHLLRRTGFGYSAAELEEYIGLGIEGAVERLLHPEQVDDAAADAAVEPVLAAFAGDPADDEIKRQQRQALFQAWYLRLLLTRRPLLERMTYFWHDHFATAISKVGNPLLMQQQHERLRAHALGAFPALLLAVARDPAMLIYLDNRANTRAAPNENYARELLELHTIGEGNGYTERDVKEAARALTGWRLQDGVASFRAQQHDPGSKTILGQTGAFDDADLMALLARHPATARHIADKLVRFFVRPDSDAALVDRVAAQFVAAGGEIRTLLRTILLSEEFYSPAAYRSLVKAPVELAVGANRALGVASDGRAEGDLGRRLGQLLFDPPNPAGWPGGPAWLSASSMLTRANYATELTMLRSKRAADVPALLRAHRATGSAAQVVDFVLDLLVGGDAPAGTRSVLIEHVGGAHHFSFERVARDGSLHGMVYLALSMPLYQVI